ALYCARPTRAFGGRALREHGERLSHPIASHVPDNTCPIQFLHHINREGSGQGCPLLRASNEHILIVRVLRARRAPGHSLPIPSATARCASTEDHQAPSPSPIPTGPRRPTTSLRPSRPAAPTMPSASICSIIRAARG